MLVQIALAGGYMGVVGFGFYHWALGAGYDEVQARTGLLLLMVFFENVTRVQLPLRDPLDAEAAPVGEPPRWSGGHRRRSRCT